MVRPPHLLEATRLTLGLAQAPAGIDIFHRQVIRSPPGDINVPIVIF
jgi:hypothetical protein